MKRALLAIWNYFRPSWEGNDGKFSYKRASQFIFMWLITYQVLNGVDNQWSFNTLLVVAILFSLTATIITVPELIKLIKYYSKTKRIDYWNDGSEVTTTVDEQDPSNLPD